ncbi:nitrite reductase large subunit NirB [uncultured Cyclobacterium sp.]|uniref:nitrite reductase large subunit NirB n=1 Tax=uncultured Cyclobacterium sp. TaxID=453820 RepID=UPI0030EF9CD3|tara:strand:+ start:106441 stop:108936 length:2496 start_codon:yes stop_codon:yes gene_type:complete
MTKIVVIGNGMVGYKFCEKLREASPVSDFEITVFGEEPWPAYDRVHLSEYFTGSTADDLILAPLSWYEDNKIDLRRNELIVTINREQKTVTSHTGTVMPYDKLVLATGSAAFVPPIEGVEKKGVFVYRTLEDLDAIINFGKNIKSAAVIGGGLLGLEAAKAVRDLGLKTHVVEFASRLMPRQLDEEGSSILKSKLEDLGLFIHLNKNTQKIKGNGKLSGLDFKDGSNLAVDMLVISAGIKPRDELAKKCGLSSAPRGGVVVNEFLQTVEDKDIYAIGEVASYQSMVYGLVAPGYEMATQVVNQLTGKEVRPFLGYDMSTKLKLIGVNVASFGDSFGTLEPSIPIVYQNKNSGQYKRINISMDGKRLLGGILVGEASAYGMLLQMTQNKMPLPPNPEDLILGARGGKESSGAGVADLPSEAQICSCENVTKGAICKIIEVDGATKLDEIKTFTKAGTGCGGCIPMVSDLLKSQLKAMGKQVKNNLCEHFHYSRQELLDLVKIKSIKTYDELLNQYGNGDGCEVCKPAVASILSSTWNELITNQDTIQDSNDRYLANIQKGGTYSVVPRIPGGEISPSKLIVIAQVAEKYGLYTKITGGQRIDMFGARVDQLPDIWEELILEGFESGHAYGKSLRTVKSCVGSTWCRYGVQDAVSFAIQVEERYRGLRSPHKLKGAVSGCIRECAEAQSKDFGLIATEKGWNLYVGGNGGSKPQHAKLLINDVDNATCLKYIDRYLMFYIRTADPLTRTSTWLNKLEGGIDYLRDVVVNDCLHIGEELEKEMEFTIQTYSCEWKEVVNNPVLRAKFKHFVNDDNGDPQVKFKQMRDQKIPATW